MGGYDSGKNPPRRIFKRNGQSLSIQRFDIEAIAAFKQMPSFQPDHFKTLRPLLEKCCVCMPIRKTEWCTPEIKELGMRNILDCRSELSPGWLSQVLPLECYIINKPLFKPFHDITPQVLSSSRVQKAIEDAAHQQTSETDNEMEVIRLLKARSYRIVQTMKATVSTIFIKIAAWGLTRFLRHILAGIQVSTSQMMMLKKCCHEDAPIIYLPLHRSHLDYILVTLTLWNFDIRAPYVAAGENLNIPFFNLLMRGLGGFFIRRRLDCKLGQKDILYRAILCQYMTEILKGNESLEFFIEGGRTRTGRTIIPKGGLLSIVVDAFNNGEIPDAFIVPASFSYEKMLDGDFCNEQLGIAKVDESFVGAMKAILGILFRNYGSIRVDFAQPFSLREFIENAKNNTSFSVDYSPDMDHPSLDRSVPDPFLERRISYPGNMISTVCQSDEVFNSRFLVKTVADHVVFIADHCSSPMSTHLVAFLLLTKHRQGVRLEDFARDLQWIVKELQALHVDVGFCGQSKDVIIYAQRLLGDKLVFKSWEEDWNEFEFRPNLYLPGVFELSYYGNFVSTHFALESALACALMQQSKLSLFQLTTFTSLPETKVNRQHVLETAGEICVLLHTEFIFVPPCTSLENALSDLLECFVSKEILHDEKDEDNGLNDRERQMANRIAMSLHLDDEDENDGFESFHPLKINLDQCDVREHLHFLVSVLGPIMESYLIVASFVLDKVFNEMSVDDFWNELGDYGRSQEENDLLIFSESCAMLNLKSAVKSLQDLGIVYSYTSAGLVMVGLYDHSEARDKLEKYTSLLKGVLS